MAVAVPSRLLSCHSLTPTSRSLPSFSSSSSSTSRTRTAAMATSSSPLLPRTSARVSLPPRVPSPDSLRFAGRTIGSTLSLRGRRPVAAMDERRNEEPSKDPDAVLFENRIVFVGSPLTPEVTQLLLSKFLYISMNDSDIDKPIYMYINCSGALQGDGRYGYESEAFAIYDAMSILRRPIYTLCVGNAWAEAVMLLAAGSKGNRAALPSASIMIKEPAGSYQGQVPYVENAGRELQKLKEKMIAVYAMHTNKTPEQIKKDIRHPKYFSPSEAIEYGIIDKVLDIEKRSKVSEVKKPPFI